MRLGVAGRGYQSQMHTLDDATSHNANLLENAAPLHGFTARRAVTADNMRNDTVESNTHCQLHQSPQSQRPFRHTTSVSHS